MRIDSLEVKMQHFDARRRMSDVEVESAYEIVNQVQRELSDEKFHVIAVQSKAEADEKIAVNKKIEFDRCYASQLGLSATVSPSGDLHMCCQYYQPTPGKIDNLVGKKFGSVWTGTNRLDMLERDPRGVCASCSPSDEFVNRFVHFLKGAHLKDETFINWAEEEVRNLRIGN